MVRECPSHQPFLLKADPDSSQAVLLIHGLAGGCYQLRWLGEYLQHQGMTAQGINLPGHESSLAKMPYTRWPQWTDHALQSYRALQQEYRNVAIVGHSMGCLVALYLATQQPIDKLVLLAPFMALRYHWYHLFPKEVYLQFLRRFADHLPRPRLAIQDPELRQLAQSNGFIRTFNLQAVASALELQDQIKRHLSLIKTPVLIIQSSQDQVVDPAWAQRLYQRLGSTHKQLHWLHNCDHTITMDKEYPQVFERVHSFLKEGCQNGQNPVS